MTRSRKSTIALFTLLAIAVSTATIEGLPTCERLIKTFRDKRVPNKVSADTLRKWALWGKTHPNFKSHPRPKYKNTRTEVVEKVAFACEVPVKPTPVDDIVPDFGNIEFGTPTIDFPPPPLPDVVEIASNGAPPLPFIPPYSPGIPPETLTPVPEPSSLLLVLTGAGMLLFLGKRSRYFSSAQEYRGDSLR